jgi:hypothetical protein
VKSADDWKFRQELRSLLVRFAMLLFATLPPTGLCIARCHRSREGHFNNVYRKSNKNSGFVDSAFKPQKWIRQLDDGGGCVAGSSKQVRGPISVADNPTAEHHID